MSSKSCGRFRLLIVPYGIETCRGLDGKPSSCFLSYHMELKLSLMETYMTLSVF